MADFRSEEYEPFSLPNFYMDPITSAMVDSRRQLPSSLAYNYSQEPGAGNIGPARTLPGSLVNEAHQDQNGQAGVAPMGIHRSYSAEEGRAAMQAVVDALSVSSIEPRDPPEGSLNVQLLPHQKLALGWMLSREGFNLRGAKAQCPNGGMLADDQGLGKTVTTIALLVTNHSEPDRNWGRMTVNLAPPKKRRKPLFSVECAISQGKDEPKDEKSASVSKDSDVVEVIDDDDSYYGETVESKTDGGSAKVEDSFVAGAQTAKAPFLPASPQRPKQAGHLSQGGTLIVAPTSLLMQWQSEIGNKVSGHLVFNTYLYHGKNRKEGCSSPEYLAQHAVVITSYTTLANECLADESVPIDVTSDEEGGDKNGLLFKIRWLRIVLDEGQMIKNSRTRAAHACFALSASHRWILSGTPIQNSVNDLYSYFKFLRWTPFNAQATFKAQIADSIKYNPQKGFKKLQQILKVAEDKQSLSIFMALLCAEPALHRSMHGGCSSVQGVLLRRMKTTMVDGKPMLDLPGCTQENLRVDFDHEEFKFYHDLKTKSMEVLAELSTTSGRQVYMNALAHLMRLRQACCHTALVKKPSTSWDPKESEVRAASQVPLDTRCKLLHILLTPDEQQSCAYCGDVPDDAVATICGHVLCRSCSLTVLGTSHGEKSCPACGHVLRASDLHSPAALAHSSKGQLPKHLANAVREMACRAIESQTIRRSSKINQLINVLDRILKPSLAPVDVAGSKPDLPEPPPSAASSKHKIPLVRRRSSNNSFLQNLTKQNLPAKRSAPGTAAPAKKSVKQEPCVVKCGNKVVVFSQWTRMLDLVEMALTEEDYEFRRLDGTMTLAKREAELNDFKSNPKIKVLLLSLRAASLGLNLVVANHVVLLDLWWNPSVEDQAIDRAHRLGQTQTVKVFRFIVHDTVEDRILQLQEQKRDVVNSTFGEGGTGSAQLTNQDLMFLFS